MPSTNFLKERDLFSACVSLELSERAGYLNRECEDGQMRDRIERLLDAHARVTSVPGFPQAAGDIADISGRYELVRVIGEGGMGTVYEARQKEPVQRRVAIKVIRVQGAGHPEATARFQVERQALAVMDHPNVAKVFDAGETLLGYPYFVMELVNGQSITEYCEERCLDLRRRLHIFTQLCHAVQHAHQKGVIHRDLKPGNVLVSDESGQAVVKVIDFGIAKAISEDAAKVTLAGGPLGTPSYMSPEQAGTGGVADIDTRTDIYSLGVILYELLTGVLPAEPDGSSYANFLVQLAAGNLRIVPPSARAGQVERVRELDWIVMRAMEWDRARRYSSAAALAEEVERFLHDEPVAAGPPHFSYRLGKFLRRNRVKAVAAAFAGLALLGGTTAATMGYVRASRAENAAREEAAAAQRMSAFLADLFEESAPERARGRDVTARELLERGAVRLQKELATEPLVRARMLETIGHVYTRMGLYPQAAPLLDEAVRVTRAQGVKGERELARALAALGNQHRTTGDVVQAEKHLTEALRLLERMYGSSHIDIADVLNEFGLLYRTSQPDKALEYYKRSHDIVLAAKGASAAVPMRSNMAALHLRAHRYQEARDIYEELLPVATVELGADNPRLGTILGNLSLVHRNLGNNKRALELSRRDLALSRKALGPEHPEVGTVTLTIARILEKCGDPAEALQQVEAALAIFRRHFQPEHGLRMTAEASRAKYLMRLGRLREGKAVVDDVLALTPVSTESQVAHFHVRLIEAEMARRSGELDEARRTARAIVAAPLVQRYPDMVADARWIAASAEAQMAAAGTVPTARAEAARAEALEAQAKVARPDLAAYMEAKYQACAGNAARALELLQEAVKLGFRDTVILDEPAFRGVEKRAEFTALAEVVRKNRL